MKLIKPYEMTYGDLAKLCEQIEEKLESARFGENLHDIGSPLASLTRNFCVDKANEYYKEQINSINTDREKIYKEVKAELIKKLSS